MDTDSIDRELATQYGLPPHSATLGRLLLVTIRSTMDVLELQPPDTLRALVAWSLEHERELPPARARVRAAYRAFAEDAIVRGEAREAELIRGITGDEPKR